jgi:hypothetical protein
MMNTQTTKGKAAKLGSEAALQNNLQVDHSLSDDGAQSGTDQKSKTLHTYLQILDLLRIKPRHTYEFRELGIANPAPRIMELIDKGHNIHKRRITIIEPDGKVRKAVSLYSLLSPTPAPALEDRDIAD